MNDYPNTVKETLMSLISKMEASPEPYVTKPGKDFTRDRKLPFGDMLKLLISMGGNSIYKELLESQGYDVNTATSSAFVQQRDKILLSAFEFLFHEFTQSHTDIKTYRGYRLLAADGSTLHIPTNPLDHESFIQRPGEKGFNLLHLNAMYDLCNRLYVDTLIQPKRCENEKGALTSMVDRSPIKDNVIVIADRSYESYNIFAHIENKGWKYLIRVKDLYSTGIVSALPHLSLEGEFDVCVRRVLTRKHTKEIMSQPETYRFLPSKATFDYLNQETEFYPISFRAVRFKLADGSYETVITNLEETDFPAGELKELYKMRWGIETSFLELKYAIGLTNFHSKKRQRIVQEVYARIIMYNFAEMITVHVVISLSDKKHVYQVNFTVAIHICRHFLRAWANALSRDVEALIRKNILPIRPGRSFKRKIRYRSAVSFLYRVA